MWQKFVQIFLSMWRWLHKFIFTIKLVKVLIMMKMPFNRTSFAVAVRCTSDFTKFCFSDIQFNSCKSYHLWSTLGTRNLSIVLPICFPIVIFRILFLAVLFVGPFDCTQFKLYIIKHDITSSFYIHLRIMKCQCMYVRNVCQFLPYHCRVIQHQLLPLTETMAVGPHMILLGIEGRKGVEEMANIHQKMYPC